MQKEILINAESQERRVCVVEGGVLQEYYIERPSEIALVGNIYKGTVNSVVSGIGAAFVDIGYSKNGFLYVSDVLAPSLDFDEPEEWYKLERHRDHHKASDINKLVKQRQELIVQVVKEPIDKKGPRLTTHIGIPGRFVVLLPFDRHIGVSKKIMDKGERKRLHQILERLSSNFKMGFIIRTQATDKSEKDFKREARRLYGLWQMIKRTAARKKAPCLLYEEQGLMFRVLRDVFSEDVDRVLVDERAEYRKLVSFANTIMPSMKRKIMLYKYRIPLFESRGIEKEIETLYRKKIELKCGGYIFIEETEGMVAIDVNSGSFSRRHIEDTAYKVNSEAALEIARQIRLRDLGGIIVIDFIDMDNEGHRRDIFNVLINAVKRDKAKINVLRMSEFGIVEMTRQRIRKGVQKVSYQSCPYCNGRGAVKSVTTMSIEVLREIKRKLERSRIKQIKAFVHPDVANYLLNEDRPSITRFENEHKAKIVIIAEPELHVERFRIEH